MNIIYEEGNLNLNVKVRISYANEILATKHRTYSETSEKVCTKSIELKVVVLAGMQTSQTKKAL